MITRSASPTAVADRAPRSPAPQFTKSLVAAARSPKPVEPKLIDVSPTLHSPTRELITPNTTLEQDGVSVMLLWLSLGGSEYRLRRKYGYGGSSLSLSASDDVSDWFGVTVEGGRVIGLDWSMKGLTGVIGEEVARLSALKTLTLGNNKLKGAIPLTIGALTSLTKLSLYHNPSLSGTVPSTLSKLVNLESLGIHGCDLSNAPTSNSLNTKPTTQAYLSSLWRVPALRLLNHGIAIATARQLSSDSSPFFYDFLARFEHGLTDIIFSYL